MDEAIEVTAAIIERDGLVLIARRPPGGRHPGCWEFPGGKVEPGETSQKCLAREMAEEMGVGIEVGELLAKGYHAYPDITIELFAFRCVIVSGEPADVGCSAHRWVRPADLASCGLLPPDLLLALAIFKE